MCYDTISYTQDTYCQRGMHGELSGIPLVFNSLRQSSGTSVNEMDVYLITATGDIGCISVNFDGAAMNIAHEYINEKHLCRSVL